MNPPNFKFPGRAALPRRLALIFTFTALSDHTKLNYRYNGRDFRLTDVAGNIVNGVMA